jgi:Zn finger protein HypA/HybF involved in hydrogenase expression
MPKISPFKSMSKDDLIKIIKECDSYSEVIEKVGLSPVGGGNSRNLKLRIKKDNIDISHFTHKRKMKQGWINGAKKHIDKKRKPIEFYLKQNTILNPYTKIRIIKENILENKCSCCGISSIWNNKPIVLQIDHKNGDSSDNRIENLRVICPNCHSQTSNFAGKNKKINTPK